MQDAGYGLAVLLFHVVQRQQSRLHAVVQQDGQHGIALQSCFLHQYLCRLEPREYRIQSENVTLQLLSVHQSGYVTAYLFLVTLNERRAHMFLQPCVQS